MITSDGAKTLVASPCLLSIFKSVHPTQNLIRDFFFDKFLSIVFKIFFFFNVPPRLVNDEIAAIFLNERDIFC